MKVGKLFASSMLALVIAFAVALAVVVGNRMSAEAMAVVIGVVCGVGASIPMSAIILTLTRRSPIRAGDSSAPQAGPPVVVVTPPAMAQPMSGWPDRSQAYPAATVPVPREYHIIGDE